MAASSCGELAPPPPPDVDIPIDYVAIRASVAVSSSKSLSLSCCCSLTMKHHIASQDVKCVEYGASLWVRILSQGLTWTIGLLLYHGHWAHVGNQPDQTADHVWTCETKALTIMLSQTHSFACFILDTFYQHLEPPGQFFQRSGTHSRRLGWQVWTTQESEGGPLERPQPSPPVTQLSFWEWTCCQQLSMNRSFTFLNVTFLNFSWLDSVFVTVCLRWLQQRENLIHLKNENPSLRIRDPSMLGPSVSPFFIGWCLVPSCVNFSTFWSDGCFRFRQIQLQKYEGTKLQKPTQYLVVPSLYTQQTEESPPSHSMIVEEVDGVMCSLAPCQKYSIPCAASYIASCSYTMLYMWLKYSPVVLSSLVSVTGTMCWKGVAWLVWWWSGRRIQADLWIWICGSSNSGHEW